MAARREKSPNAPAPAVPHRPTLAPAASTPVAPAPAAAVQTSPLVGIVRQRLA